MSVLERLVGNSRRAIDEGVYDSVRESRSSGVSLVSAIRAQPRAPVIAEVKPSSPSEGTIRKGADPAVISRDMAAAGAVAISVLTQPHEFGGSPEALARVRESVSVPVMMKDVIVGPAQVDAARRLGADYVLLIQAVFDRGLAGGRDGLIDLAHAGGMGVLLEAHTRAELESALASRADIVGVNNRSLETLEVSLETTRELLAGLGPRRVQIVSESGISGPEDVRLLRSFGADAFLAGTSVMRSRDVGAAVRGLVGAL
ncbi:MAG: indole-3-glycerol-phosphate synthase [Thaumarchaeota archaeon]|nr:indole-3-glycerol-phosphate synthase [Nitrososphaerota archaeon]MDD9813185.1 indole-3-glycerol-phosphate synthase [Nitrososphaerota archaeon]MDD9825692.1 indole-3-glycerol-phosphate synthase [Nitrososphaerota archaeon]MDD9843310.1 indole-3-glycerol-phosphate synthase [Nitrososphaerota archaeon]